MAMSVEMVQARGLYVLVCVCDGSGGIIVIISIIVIININQMHNNQSVSIYFAQQPKFETNTHAPFL